MPNNTSNQTENYWSERYATESTGWDLGQISPPLRAYIHQLTNQEAQILIPGAGNGHEAEYLYRHGFKNVHILDIAQQPLLDFKKRNPDFPSEQILHHDFFELKGQFDLIIEQTFFCSFPPIDHMRERYAQQMFELLKPGGTLAGLWFDFPLTTDLVKRPFGGSMEEYTALFGRHFEIKTLSKAHNSVEARAGRELFGVFVKKMQA